MNQTTEVDLGLSDSDRFEILGKIHDNIWFARDLLKVCDHDFQSIVIIKGVRVEQKEELQKEVEVYETLGPRAGFATLRWVGEWGDLYCIALDYKGCNFGDLRTQFPMDFKPELVAMYAFQMIKRIKALHDAGFVHGDIKPDNFTLGPEMICSAGIRGIPVINLIDFGSATRSDNKALPWTSNAAFASIRSLLGQPLSKVGDLESLAYTLIYLVLGEDVPWVQELPVCMMMLHSGRVHMASIKAEIVPEELCGALPPIFAKFLRYTRELPLTAQPDYDLYEKEFKMVGHDYDLFEEFYVVGR